MNEYPIALCGLGVVAGATPPQGIEELQKALEDKAAEHFGGFYSVIPVVRWTLNQALASKPLPPTVRAALVDKGWELHRRALGYATAIPAANMLLAECGEFAKAAAEALSAQSPPPADDEGLIWKLTNAAQHLRETVPDDYPAYQAVAELLCQAAERLATLESWATGPNGVKWYTDRYAEQQAEIERLTAPATPSLPEGMVERARLLDNPPQQAAAQGRACQRAEGEEVLTVAAYHERRKAREERVAETEANVFASYLLMPESTWRKDVPNGFDIADDEEVKRLARRYDVPIAAVCFRLMLDRERGRLG